MFDVHNELSALKTQTQHIRKRCYRARKSRLDKYTFELLTLYRAGASTAELQRWLRAHHIKVVHSTVSRWLSSQNR